VTKQALKRLVSTRYHRYGRLVVLSFALYRAKSQNAHALPWTFVEVSWTDEAVQYCALSANDIVLKFQKVASNIIECFEKDWDDQGLSRGCPDFMYTVLTFAVVSLLKVSGGTLVEKNHSGRLTRSYRKVRPSAIQGAAGRIARPDFWLVPKGHQYAFASSYICRPPARNSVCLSFTIARHQNRPYLFSASHATPAARLGRIDGKYWLATGENLLAPDRTYITVVHRIAGLQHEHDQSAQAEWYGAGWAGFHFRKANMESERLSCPSRILSRRSRLSAITKYPSREPKSASRAPSVTNPRSANVFSGIKSGLIRGGYFGAGCLVRERQLLVSFDRK
jgi:hypothetical protein